jgi:hypothetical protein
MKEILCNFNIYLAEDSFELQKKNLPITLKNNLQCFIENRTSGVSMFMQEWLDHFGLCEEFACTCVDSYKENDTVIFNQTLFNALSVNEEFLKTIQID